MSRVHYINDLLEIKDANVIFHENIEKIQRKNQTYHLLHAELKYQPECCKHCDCLFDESFHIHGYTYSNVRHVTSGELPTIIRLRKQRYMCGHCARTFVVETPLVKEHCCISNSVKQAIKLSASHIISEKDIGIRHHVSAHTVSRIVHAAHDIFTVDYHHLPAVLSFDEFKATKDTTGAMAFIFADPIQKKLIDILDTRKLYELRRYFHRFPKHVREQVQFICIDMYAPYFILIKEVFPNATICVDKFHIVQLLSRALNKTRIQIMNVNKVHYNKLKRYHKLLMKDSYHLSSSHYRWCPSFRTQLSSSDIVDRLLAIDSTLHASYRLYQDALGAIRRCDSIGLYHALKQTRGISTYMQTAVTTLEKDDISNGVISTLQHGYSNGFIEGCNNKIKTLKRVAFGYRHFSHFKARILLIFGFPQIKYA